MSRPVETSLLRQPLVVALAGWLLPGLGYSLIGHKLRGLVVGITIIVLFVIGLLIGGVRSLEVPTAEREDLQRRRLEMGVNEPPIRPALMDEIRAKPWSIAQVMNGPMAIVAGAASIWAGTVHVEPATATTPERMYTVGDESHARVNEIAVLYTAVAGMLNLLAMIDSASRAARVLEGTA